MNWEALGAIAEMLGALAVISTIAYLAMQVRGAREELRHSIEQNSEASNSTLALEMIRNPELRAANLKAIELSGKQLPSEYVLKKMDGLTEDEASLLGLYYYSFWLSFSDTIDNAEYLSEEKRESLNSRLRFTYGDGPQKLWFDSFSEGRSSARIEYVRKVLAGDA